MPKYLLQDLVKVKNIKKGAIEPELKKFRVKQDSKKPRFKLWFVAVISIVFFLFALSYLFSRATVTVNPKMQDIILNKNLSANKDDSANTLPFDLVVISGEENKIMQTTERKNILQKAQGIAVIYNTFSSSSQALDIDTRLEGSNGKIYKTKTRITVPGMTADGKPGAIEAKIYSAEAGTEYNSAPLDFKILGFKGTSKYAKFYGRSKGEIAGGFKGQAPVVSDEQKLTAISDLKTALRTKLLKNATGQIPDGFVLFKNAIFFNTSEAEVDLVSAKDNMLPIKLQGTLYGLLFNENKLTKKIVESGIEKYDDSAVFIPNIRDLTFSLSDKSYATLAEAKNINFNLSGSAKIVWQLDTNKFINDLSGKSKKDFNQILLQYPNIDSANLALSPFWRSSIPDKMENIKVIVNYPK